MRDKSAISKGGGMNRGLAGLVDDSEISWAGGVESDFSKE